MDKKRQAVEDYFFDNYSNKEAHHLCSLCGQRGIIDTRGVKTPAGVECGRLNWCLCPNGRAMREQTGGRLPADFPEYAELMLNDSVDRRVLTSLMGKTIIKVSGMVIR